MEEIRPGMTGKEADAITRDYITEHGHGDDFGHSTGHGIGLKSTRDQPFQKIRKFYLNRAWSLHVNRGYMYRD